MKGSTRFLMERKIRGIAHETVRLADGRLPLLAPMSEMAGRMAPQVGAAAPERPKSGRWASMGGAAGVAPANVVLLGARMRTGPWHRFISSRGRDVRQTLPIRAS
jgi:alanine dehydrogenase